MKKIVELIVNLDDLELDGTGVDAIALVANPAIELDFLAFNNEEFVLPNAGESQDEFIGRCIPVLIDEGYDSDQATAICYNYWEGKFDGLEDACWPGYEAIGTKDKNGRQVPNCVPLNAEKFESYTDYPESATNAAKRALEWRDANPDQGCGTRVGWARANQLANREPISEETIARMASFARHLQWKDVPYSEGCGGLMVDAWGGQAGIEWAQNKLEEIRSEFAINTSGLTPYVDQISDPEKKEKHTCFNDESMSEEQKWILSECEKMGVEYDPHTALFIDATRASFSTVEDFIKGITALDILGKKAKTDEGVQVFRYAGPPAERGFCRAMMRLNKVYRYEEIQELNTKNPGFGPRGASRYNVFEYKGGPNCRHYFESLTMFESDGRKIFINQGPAANYNTDKPGAGNAGQSNNMNSPSATGSVANNAWLERRNFSFNIDEDQRIVIGPAMIPNKMIKRKDDNGNPYYVYFTETTIRQIAEDYFEKYKQNNTNIEHNSDETHTRNTLLESWIVEDPKMDKSAIYGFDVPKGSWMVSMRINDDETWNQIKEGKLRGYSVEGYFIEKSQALRAVEDTYQQILDILGKIED